MCIRDRDFLRELAAEISIVKNNRLDAAAYAAGCCPPETFRFLYGQYARACREAKKLDFDDVLTQCCALFERRPDILAKWQDRFRYILIDEFQDINRIQYDVIRMLAAPQDNPVSYTHLGRDRGQRA